MFSSVLRSARRFGGPALAAASACALVGDAHLEAASDPKTQAHGMGPIIESRRSLRMGDVYDFVASETVSSSRTEAAYIERGPLVICSGGTNADFTASVGEMARETIGRFKQCAAEFGRGPVRAGRGESRPGFAHRRAQVVPAARVRSLETLIGPASCLRRPQPRTLASRSPMWTSSRLPTAKRPCGRSR